MSLSPDILKVDNLSKYFGGLAAVSNCSLNIKKGSITGVIGPNGSGKTTLFNLIAGNLKPNNGKVLFNSEDITGTPSYELFSKGILRTFQIAHEFTNLTVLENLMMVPGNQSGENLMNAFLKPGLIKQEEDLIRQKAYEVIEFLNLKHLANELAGNLSGGQKKLLELGRTMMVDAKLVLLDEVGAGVNRTLLKDLGTAILRLNKEEKKIKEKALEVIDFLNLAKLSKELAGNLSGGQKKLLELGRTMMVNAKLVLLDEVGAGVNRTLLKDIGSAILRLNKEKGYTFCMIEHDMDFISRMCNPVIVMSEGSVLFQGTPDEVKKNEKVIESYLGRANKINGENN